MVISLLNFLQTGALGSLTPGMTQDEIVNVVGKPDTEGGTSRKYPRPSIWKYGIVELLFDHADHKCRTIYIESPSDQPTFRFPAHWTVKDWGLTPWLPEADVQEYLTNQCLHFEREVISSTAGLVVFPKNVRLGFNQNLRLCSVASSQGSDYDARTVHKIMSE